MAVETPITYDALNMFHWLYAWVPVLSGPSDYIIHKHQNRDPVHFAFWRVPDGADDNLSGYRVYHAVHIQILAVDGRRCRGFVGIFNQGVPGMESVQFCSAGDTYQFQRLDYTRNKFMRDIFGLMYRRLHGF